MTMDKQIQALLDKLSPEQQAFANDYARVKLEAKMAKAAVEECNKKYMNLYLFVLAILRGMPNYEIKFSAEDLEGYAAFGDAWQLETFYEELEGEGWQILRLVEKGGTPDASPSEGSKDA